MKTDSLVGGSFHVKALARCHHISINFSYLLCGTLYMCCSSFAILPKSVVWIDMLPQLLAESTLQLAFIVIQLCIFIKQNLGTINFWSVIALPPKHHNDANFSKNSLDKPPNGKFKKEHYPIMNNAHQHCIAGPAQMVGPGPLRGARGPGYYKVNEAPHPTPSFALLSACIPTPENCTNSLKNLFVHHCTSLLYM